MTDFGNIRPEENWQCIDLDPLYTVSCGKFFTVFKGENLRHDRNNG